MGIPNKLSPMTGGGSILPRGYIQVQGILFSNNIQLSVNVTDSRKPTEMVSEFCVITEPSTWDSILGYWDDNVKCYNRLGVSHSAYVPIADSNKIYYRKQSGASILNYMQDLILNKWYNFHAFADGKMTLNKELYNYEDVGTTLYSYSLLHLNFIARTNVYGHQAFVYDGNIQFDLYPCITPSGVVAFFDKAKNEVLSVSSPIAYLTSLQARNLSKLPIVESGTLTVSLPWDAQWNIGVQNALSIAATRGWTITVQYRDPEVATTPMPIGFLESTGTQYIDTAVLSGPLSFNAVVRGSAGSSCCVIGGRRGDQYGNNILGSVVRNGWQFVYDSWLETGKYTYQPLKKYHVRSNLGTLFVDGVIASKAENVDFSQPYSLFAFANNRNNTEVTLMTSMQMWYLTIKDKSDILVRTFVPVLDKNGIPCMYDRVTKQPFYNIGTGAFIAGFDTIEQARNLAHLPDVTAETDAAKKSLTVSLPWEAQLVITGVPAALQVAADRGWTITVQYREPEADNAYYNKYATCTTVPEMRAINTNYKADLTVDGTWIYPLPLISNARDMLCENRGLTAVSADMSMCTNAVYAFAYCPNLKSFSGSLLSLQNGEQMINNSRQFKYFDASVPALSNGQLMFNYCILDKGSALNVLNSIPTYTSGTHNLTIGIHIDYQNDEEVLTAITNAEAKGWTVTVQWNGTATAAAASVSTFGLRSPVIYAKLVTMERPDDTTEQILDWGHYVTNWEENGYQEFSSVEEAEEYFNINQTEEV